MKEKLKKFLRIDRRWIFLLLTIVMFWPIIHPFGLAGKTSQQSVRDFYDFIEKVQPGQMVILGVDYDPSTKPELHPQAIAALRHLMSRDIRVLMLTFISGAPGMMEELRQIPSEYGKEYGKDYVIMPYNPNYMAAMTQMSIDINKAYDKDMDGSLVREMPVMQGIKTYKDIAGVVEITGTGMLDAWVAYVGDKYDVPLIGGTTAISQLGFGPYLQNKQIKGLLGGMRGASEYENLIGKPGKATSGIDALNLAHLLVIVLILTSNIIIFATKERN